ncbi:hypothetical protein [Bacillus safensis]|nr:hypothetical protein [Bacillus safensis]
MPKTTKGHFDAAARMILKEGLRQLTLQQMTEHAGFQKYFSLNR